MTSFYKNQQLQLQQLPRLPHQLQEILEQDFNGGTYVVNRFGLWVLLFFRKTKKILLLILANCPEIPQTNQKSGFSSKISGKFRKKLIKYA